jgi:hypothetical protein
VNMPRFSAEASLHQTNVRYRTNRAQSARVATASLTPALPIGSGLQWVDCNKFYNQWVCQECGADGPESIQCCSGDNCAVIDKNPVLRPPTEAMVGRFGGAYSRSSL